jgi:drug/metabolite transporter (DMT)-like permease
MKRCATLAGQTPPTQNRKPNALPNSDLSKTAASNDRSAARGRLLLIASAIAFSSAGFFTREAPVNLWAMVFWRNLFGSAALVLLIVVLNGRGAWRSVLLLGRWGWATIVASSLSTICFLGAFAYTSVADVSIIYATAPLVTALVAWAWLGEQATRITLAASFLALLGVAVTISGSFGGGGAFGDALALIMTLTFSAMTVLARRHAGLSAMVTTCVASLVAALAALPLGWSLGASFAVSPHDMAWLAAFGIVTMTFAFPCYLAGAAHVPAAQAMLLSALEMPLGPLWVWLAFGERPALASFIGGGIVALAILLQLSRVG